MAKLKTPEDVEIARIEAYATIEKARLKYHAITTWILVLGMVLLAGIASWAVVQVTDKPAWLQLSLAVAGLIAETFVVIHQHRVIAEYKRISTTLGSVDDAEDRGSNPSRSVP